MLKCRYELWPEEISNLTRDSQKMSDHRSNRQASPKAYFPLGGILRAHQFFRFWACALLFRNCAKRKSAIRQEVEPLSTFKRKNGKGIRSKRSS